MASTSTLSPPREEWLLLCHPRLPSRRQGSHINYLFLSEGSCFNSEKHRSSCEPLSIPGTPEVTTLPWPELSQNPEKPGLSCASSIKQLTCFQLVSQFLLRFQRGLDLGLWIHLQKDKNDSYLSTHTPQNSEDKKHRKQDYRVMHLRPLS